MNIEYSFWTTVSDKSPMKVLFELVRKSEGILQRIEETQNGFVLAISVAGQANSGAIYIYDKPCGALFMLVLDGRDDDFSRREIGCLVPAVAAHLNAPLCDPRDTAQRVHHRRFADAVAPHQRHPLAGAHLEGHAVEYAGVTVERMHLAESQERHQAASVPR